MARKLLKYWCNNFNCIPSESSRGNKKNVIISYKLSSIKNLLIILIRKFIKFGRKTRNIKIIHHLYSRKSFLVELHSLWTLWMLTYETERNQDIFDENKFRVKSCVVILKRGFLGMCFSAFAQTKDILVSGLFLTFSF